MFVKKLSRPNWTPGKLCKNTHIFRKRKRKIRHIIQNSKLKWMIGFSIAPIPL